MTTEPIVVIIDDDAAVRSGLALLLASAGLRSACYAAGLEFLSVCHADQPGCILLDVRMPGLSGLELQERLHQRQVNQPIIVLTGHADVPMAVRAMKRGAFDFIEKPFSDQFLLDRVQQAIALDHERRNHAQQTLRVGRLLNLLTARERQVLDALVQGDANKVIAAELGISERTVELHRSNVLKKMQVRSVAQLVQCVLAVRREDPGD